MNKEQQCDRNAFKEDGPSSSGGASPRNVVAWGGEVGRWGPCGQCHLNKKRRFSL